MILVLMNLAVGGDVDVWGHLGGFLSGLSVSLML
jgi:membrane associated rhomboid family serine protease